MFSVSKRNSKSRTIAFLLLIFVGSMVIAGHTMAAGGAGGTDVHLEMGEDLNLKDGVKSEAIAVGLFILLAVYALIITAAVHR